jgi:hypothetical protein
LKRITRIPVDELSGSWEELRDRKKAVAIVAERSQNRRRSVAESLQSFLNSSDCKKKGVSGTEDLFVSLDLVDIRQCRTFFLHLSD